MISLADLASDAMLNALASVMAGGSIELLTDNRHVLATLYLSTPAAGAAAGGEIELNEIAEDVASAQGTVTVARVLTRDGDEIFVCDVGTLQSDATIRLNSTQIGPGAPVRIDSFRLAMP